MQSTDNNITCYNLNTIFTNQMNLTSSVMLDKQNPGYESVRLPDEILLLIMQKLSLKELISARKVNLTWFELSKDSTIWKAFGVRLGIWGNPAEIHIVSVVRKCLQQIQQIKLDQNVTEGDILSHLKLSKMGFCSLEETTKLATQVKQVNKYSNNCGYYAIAFEYLYRNQPLELEKILPKMSSSESKGVVATALIEYYLKESSFEKALAMMDFLKPEQSGWINCFYSLIQTAYTNKNYAFMIEILKKYSLLNRKSYSIWAGCIVALQNLLLEKNIIVADQLRAYFPQAWEVAYPMQEIKYYIFIQDLKKAEAIALNCKGNDKYFALREIQKYYEKNKNETEIKRIRSLMMNI